jgi:hypothetical protein
MSPAPPIPPELWDHVPPAAQAALLAFFQEQRRRIASLEQLAAPVASAARQLAGLAQDVRRSAAALNPQRGDAGMAAAPAAASVPPRRRRAASAAAADVAA